MCELGCVMTDTFVRWPVTAEARLRFRASLSEICDAQRDSGTLFSYKYLGFILYHFHQYLTLIFIFVLFMLESTGGWSVGTFKPVGASSDIGGVLDSRVLILSEEFAVDLGHTERCGKPKVQSKE
jgi:hypothetical protein